MRFLIVMLLVALCSGPVLSDEIVDPDSLEYYCSPAGQYYDEENPFDEEFIGSGSHHGYYGASSSFWLYEFPISITMIWKLKYGDETNKWELACGDDTVSFTSGGTKTISDLLNSDQVYLEDESWHYWYVSLYKNYELPSQETIVEDHLADMFYVDFEVE